MHQQSVYMCRISFILTFIFNSERIPNKVLDSRQRSQLYIALKNANSTILKFLHSLSVSQIPLDSNDPKTKVTFVIEVSARIILPK